MVVKEDLQLWFGLSRATFCVLPRVLMEAMPKEWQRQITKLLNEYQDMFKNQPDIETRVFITCHGKIIKTPEWLLNYRHPDHNAINNLKGIKI